MAHPMTMNSQWGTRERIIDFAPAEARKYAPRMPRPQWRPRARQVRLEDATRHAMAARGRARRGRAPWAHGRGREGADDDASPGVRA